MRVNARFDVAGFLLVLLDTYIGVFVFVFVCVCVWLCDWVLVCLCTYAAGYVCMFV